MDPALYIQKHHIIPLHNGGPDTIENLVELTFLAHKEANFVRWVAYGQKGDLSAFRFMNNETEEGSRLKAQLAGEKGGVVTQTKFRAENKGWFNNENQSKSGTKKCRD